MLLSVYLWPSGEMNLGLQNPFLPPFLPLSLTDEQSEDRALKCFTPWDTRLK